MLLSCLPKLFCWLRPRVCFQTQPCNATLSFSFLKKKKTLQRETVAKSQLLLLLGSNYGQIRSKTTKDAVNESTRMGFFPPLSLQRKFSVLYLLCIYLHNSSALSLTGQGPWFSLKITFKITQSRLICVDSRPNRTSVGKNSKISWWKTSQLSAEIK